MNKSSIWKVILIVCAAIGVIAILGVVGMLLMHQRMMGGLSCC
ncbi:hypothetical protein [Burkholderia sp. LMG 13014]|nr:hypothetical protein [Burkholderia sp. LMG 13014]